MVPRIGSVWRSRGTGNRYRVVAVVDIYVRVEALDGGRFKGCEPHEYSFHVSQFTGGALVLM